MFDNNSTFMTIFHLFTAAVAGFAIANWLLDRNKEKERN